jgi:hypothetical protein
MQVRIDEVRHQHVLLERRIDAVGMRIEPGGRMVSRVPTSMICPSRTATAVAVYSEPHSRTLEI